MQLFEAQSTHVVMNTRFFGRIGRQEKNNLTVVNTEQSLRDEIPGTSPAILLALPLAPEFAHPADGAKGCGNTADDFAPMSKDI